MTNEAQNHKTDCPELEVLAALVDDRLEGEERQNVVEHLSNCEACYEIFTETLRFQEEEAKGGQVLVLPTEWRRWLWAAASVAAAAALALVVALPLWQTFRDGGGSIAVGRLAANLVEGTEAGALMPLAYSGDGWSRTRGFGTGLNERQRAFRLGVRTVDLELALRAGDAERATLLLHELSNTARDLPLPEMILASYDELLERLQSGEVPDSSTRHSAAAASLIGDAAKAPYYALGQWSEAGLVAASSGNADFFNRRFVRSYPENLEAAELPDSIQVLLQTISAQLDQEVQDTDLVSLAEAFAQLVELGGNV